MLEPPPELPKGFEQYLLRCYPPQLKHYSFLDKVGGLLSGFFGDLSLK